MYRVLVTGSRHWKDVDAVRAFLADKVGDREDVVLVHGAADGLDSVAAAVAEEKGWKVEGHPADWNVLHKAAGGVRNSKMVNLGADICLAFPLPGSIGTYDCARKAKKRGIPTFFYGVAEPDEPAIAEDDTLRLF